MSNDQRSRLKLPYEAACNAGRYLFLVAFSITFFLQQSLGLCSVLLNINDYPGLNSSHAGMHEVKPALGTTTSSRPPAVLLQIEVAEDDDLPEENTLSVAVPLTAFPAMSLILEQRVSISLLRQSSVVQDIKTSPLFLLHQSWKGFLS
jgi:hypothetical protein